MDPRIDCRYETARLAVLPWHDAASTEELAAFVSRLLTPAVTEGLPAGWQGTFDARRAIDWIADRDHEADPLLVIESEGHQPVGLLILAAAGDEGAEVRLGYLLHEAHWGRGLGTELIGGLVDWCRTATKITAIVGGVAVDNVASSRILLGHGFLEDGPPHDGEQMYRLTLEARAGVTIRAETPTDHEAIRTVVVDAFGSSAEGDLVDRIRASREFLPSAALVAELAGEVVGHVMVSGALVRNQDGERPIVMLSPLAVAPAHQRRGVGAALVHSVVDVADSLTEPLVVLEGSPDYYGRLGFVPAARHGLSLPLPDWAPPEAAQVKLLPAYDPTDPTLRGDVIYPVAFDGLD